MPRLQGTVQSIDRKTTQGGKTYYRIQVDGRWFSAWAKPEFTQGDAIEFDDIQNGDFHNLANAKKLEAPIGGGGNTPVSPNRQTSVFDSDRESRIVRQNATSSAIALVAASKLGGKADVETLLATVKETAKRIFEMNFFGYAETPPTGPKDPTPEGDAASLFKY